MSSLAWRRARVLFAIAIGLLLCVEAILLANWLSPDPAKSGVVVRLEPIDSHQGVSLEGINTVVHAQRQWAEAQWATAIAANQAAEVARARARRTVPNTSSPAPSQTVQNRGPSGCAVESLIRSVWTRDADWAIGIAMRESHCQAGARNPSGANGIFQMLGHADIFEAIGCPDQFNAECNIRAAWQLYQGSGRRPWS